MSSDFIHTPLSTSSITPINIHHNVDIREYIVTDPQRINRTSIDNHLLPFSFRQLNRKEQMILQQAISGTIITFPSIVNISG